MRRMLLTKDIKSDEWITDISKTYRFRIQDIKLFEILNYSESDNSYLHAVRAYFDLNKTCILVEKLSKEEAQQWVNDFIDRYYTKKSADILTALRWALQYIDAIPKDIQLPSMPGFDRDWVNGLLESEER
jgi:hypothetical protein